MTKQGPLSGQKLANKYLLGDLLGEGGFGAVYKAQHLQLRRQQAIKILLENLFSKSNFRDRFLREAQTVAALDHPYIVHVDDFWIEATQAYLVMPFIGRGTLQDILQKQQHLLELDQVASYLGYICTALDYAHQHGVVHLDLKPLNLLVHEDGRLLLSDFGLAHMMKQGAIEGGTSLAFGTPHYMAPEHIQGHPEKRSDLYSLGVILYQMLLGRRPFEGLPPEAVLIKNVNEWPPQPRVIRPDLPQIVEEVLGKALGKQPEQRYQTANELLFAFREALTNTHKTFYPSRSLHDPSTMVEINSSEPRSDLPLKSPLQNSSNSILYVEEGKESGRVYEIRKEYISIGRSRDRDIVLDDIAVNRLHATVVNVSNNDYALRDEGSANGTWVNGQVVNSRQLHPLQDGDRIQIGQHLLVFLMQ